MFSPTDLPPISLPVFAQPRPSSDRAPESTFQVVRHAGAINQMLAALLDDESALYALAREWYHDLPGQGFPQLRLLLDEQVAEIGGNLTRLAARTRDLAARNRQSLQPRSIQAAPVLTDAVTQIDRIRELLRRHEALINGLKRGALLADTPFHDRETTKLLADLTANHEKDAFMLRALLWEVQNPTT